MKVALILATNVEKSPYIQYYIDVYKEKNIDVEVILLNRDKRVLNEELRRQPLAFVKFMIIFAILGS